MPYLIVYRTGDCAHDAEITTMQIDLDQIDAALANDIAGDTETGYSLHELPYDGAKVQNQCWQVLWHHETGRAGVVFQGSGSSGATHWTDADSPEDAVRRVVEDDLRP